MASPAPKVSKTVFITAPRKVEVREAELASPGPGEVLVRALASGISAGTEMNVYRGVAPQWRRKQDPKTRLFVAADEPEWRYPIAYGYACIGTVAQLGPEVRGLREGQAVFAYAPHRTYSVVAADRVVPLDALPSPELGVFLPNLNTAYNGVLDARPCLGANVVVFGLGVIGQLVIRLLARTGPRQLIAVDTIASRRELALASGADLALDPGEEPVAERVRALTHGQGADVVVEVSGNPLALHEAIRTAGYSGLVVAMSWYGGSFEALELSGEFHHNRIHIRSSQVAAVNPELGPLWTVQRRMKQALEMLPELEPENLISHRIPVTEAARAYGLVDERPQEVMQVVLTYGDDT